MPSFETKTFNFYTLDYDNVNHINAMNRLISDKDVIKYIGSIDLFLGDVTPNILDNSYLVGFGDNIVGYLGLFDYEKYLEMQYAILKPFRGFKLSSGDTVAKTILKESSQNIFDNYKRLEYIRLLIEKSNIKSIKLAQSCGFIETLNYHKIDEYRKYR